MFRIIVIILPVLIKRFLYHFFLSTIIRFLEIMFLKAEWYENLEDFSDEARKIGRISGRLLLLPNMDHILFRHALLYGYNYIVIWFMEPKGYSILLIGHRLVILFMIINTDRLVWMVSERKFMIW